MIKKLKMFLKKKREKAKASLSTIVQDVIQLIEGGKMLAMLRNKGETVQKEIVYVIIHRDEVLLYIDNHRVEITRQESLAIIKAHNRTYVRRQVDGREKAACFLKEFLKQQFLIR